MRPGTTPREDDRNTFEDSTSLPTAAVSEIRLVWPQEKGWRLQNEQKSFVKACSIRCCAVIGYTLLRTALIDDDSPPTASSRSRPQNLDQIHRLFVEFSKKCGSQVSVYVRGKSREQAESVLVQQMCELIQIERSMRCA